MACTCPPDDVPGWCLHCWAKLEERLIAQAAIPPNLIQPESGDSGRAKFEDQRIMQRKLYGEAQSGREGVIVNG